MVNSLRKDVFTDTKILILKLLLASFEAAYSLIWGALEFGERVEGRPWHFYDK